MGFLGLDSVSSGEVWIGDVRIDGLSDKALTALRRDRIGFVFQQFNLLPTLTAEENITLPMAIAGRSVDRAGSNRVDSQRLNPLVGRKGHAPTRPGEILIDAKLAAAAGYSVGDEARVVRTPSGLLGASVVGIAGYSDGSDSLGGSRVIVFDTATATRVILDDSTFNILIARRTNELALLRAIDAATE